MRSPQPIPAGAAAMSLTEIAAEVKADHLTLEQAYAVLRMRPADVPNDWRPGDPLPPSGARSERTGGDGACERCGRATVDLAAPGEVRP